VTLRWRATAALLGLLVAGCEAERAAEDDAKAVAGTVSGAHAYDHGSLRVAFGKRWVTGGDVAVDAAGAFRVPPSARAVVAYLDTNGNERFDRFAEPSGDCVLAAQGWTCSLMLQRTTLHRSMSARNREHGDQTLIFWEDFTSNGARVESSQLCVDKGCTQREAAPFVSPSPADVRVFSLCGEEGFPDQQAVIRNSTQVPAIAISQPARLDVTVRSEPPERHGGELQLRVQSPAFDRLLVFAGTVKSDSGEVNRVYWSSETADIRMTETPGDVEVRIPAALVRSCQQDPACEIVIQVVKYWSAPGAAVVRATEYRSTVSFRGPS
jgi:hypothetical protein